MANLVELFDNIVQMQNLNGVPLANGKMYVYALGRTRLMDTWSDVDGESLNSNPIILDAAGQCHCYVSDDFDYTLVVTDAYDNEIFSIDKYLYSQGSHSHADVAVAPSETIAVSSYHVGETTVYVPYLTGQLGKVYTGIDPIVVNNTEDKISANHVALGVQDPLYFVQDDEEGCIIGFSGQTIPEGVMTESGLGFENNKITGYNGSAFSAGNEYEAGSYVDITDNTISVTGLPTSADVQNIVDVATSGLMPSGDYLTKESADTLYAPTGNYLTGLPEDLVYTADITGFATTAQLDEKLDKSDSAKFYPMDSNPSGYLTGLPSDLATTGWVDSQGYLTAVDIPESAVWNATTQTVSANSAQWAGGTANPQIPVTSTSGISIFESGDQVYFNISADYATEDWVTAQGYLTAETDWTNTITAASANAYNEATAQVTGKQDTLTFAYHDTAISSIDNSALYDNSAHARINTLAGRISDLSSNKLDSAIYANDSGTFLTALPSDLVYTADIQDMATTGDLTGKQDITGMTAYATLESLTAKQDAGEYLSASDSANFLLTSDSGNFYPMNENPSGYLTAHQSLAEYQTTADMVNYQLTADMTGYLTGIPDTYLQNTDLTITDGKVTEISGVPLSAGDELPESVSAATDYITATSANIDSTIDNVSANSGAWGGSALPISAGPGIKFSMVANTLVASTDETVLFENSAGASESDSFTVSEQFTNFELIRYIGATNLCNFSVEIPTYSNITATFRFGVTCMCQDTDGAPLQLYGKSFISNDGLTYTPSRSQARWLDYNTQTSVNGTQPFWGTLYKIVGINRKSGV